MSTIASNNAGSVQTTLAATTKPTEPASLKHRDWTLPRPTLSSSSSSMTVMSYNILGEWHGDSDRHAYAPACVRAWSQSRWPRIRDELTALRPCVVALQEVQRPQFDKHLAPFLHAAGYTCVYNEISPLANKQAGLGNLIAFRSSSPPAPESSSESTLSAPAASPSSSAASFDSSSSSECTFELVAKQVFRLSDALTDDLYVRATAAKKGGGSLSKKEKRLAAAAVATKVAALVAEATPIAKDDVADTAVLPALKNGKDRKFAAGIKSQRLQTATFLLLRRRRPTTAIRTGSDRRSVVGGSGSGSGSDSGVVSDVDDLCVVANTHLFYDPAKADSG
jgi:hypothetical protein